jgi:hypothetical protein
METRAQDIIGQDIRPGNFPKWFIDYNYFNPGAFEFLAGPPLFTVNGPSAPSAGWIQLTLTVTGGVYTFYLNGVDEGSTPGQSPGYPWPDPNAPLVFSFGDGGGPTQGIWRDVVIDNRALTPGEVADLSSLSATPEPSTWALMLVGFGGLGQSSFRKAGKGRRAIAAA